MNKDYFAAMLRGFIKLIRPTQWLKNLILLAALIFAGEATHPDKAITALAAVLVYCLLSSSLYILNDIVDRDKDKNHPLKKNRPVAAGIIPTSGASVLALFFLILGLGTAWTFNLNFFIISCVFISLNLLYSFWLKHIVIVDVMTIAASFVIRAYAGAFAIDVPASKWLIINTLLLALFLGFGKRRHELVLLEKDADTHRRALDRYSPYLLDQLIGVVTASVVVMYMLYTFSTEVMDKLGTSNLYFTIPFVIFGIFRYLYLIHKEERGGSPTRVLISDLPILFTVIFWVLTVYLVLYVK